MRWSQTVRLNLANDRRNFAVSDLILAADDTINISNIDTYTVSDFKKVLDFGRNVLSSTNITDPNLLSVRGLRIGENEEVEITESHINTLNSLEYYDVNLLQNITLKHIDYSFYSGEAIHFNKSIDVKGQVVSKEIYSKKINLFSDDSDNTLSIDSNEIIFQKSADDSSGFLHISSDKIQFDNGLNSNTTLQNNKLLIQNDDSGKLHLENGVLNIEDLSGNSLKLGTSSNNNFLRFEDYDNSGNFLEFRNNYFESKNDKSSIVWDSGNIILKNTNESSKNSSIKLLNDLSGNGYIKLEKTDSKCIIDSDKLICENSQGSFGWNEFGEIILKNNSDNSGGEIKIGPNPDLSGNMIFLEDSDSNHLKIGVQSLELSSITSSLNINSNTIKLQNKDTFGSIFFNSNPGFGESHIEIQDNDKSIKFNNSEICISSSNDSFKINEFGFSLLSKSKRISSNLSKPNEYEILLNFGRSEFGPEIKLFVNAESLAESPDSQKVGIVIVVNLGQLMNISSNTEDYQDVNTLLSQHNTDYILSFNNSSSVGVEYKRVYNIVYFRFKQEMNLKYNLMTIS